MKRNFLNNERALKNGKMVAHCCPNSRKFPVHRIAFQTSMTWEKCQVQLGSRDPQRPADSFQFSIHAQLIWTITTNSSICYSKLISIFYSRLLEMRMPRSSSFSVRDILDLPQMKNNSSITSTTTSDTSSSPPTGTQGVALGTTDISNQQQRFHGKLLKC